MATKKLRTGAAIAATSLLIAAGGAAAGGWKIQSIGWLHDLQTTTENPTDGAHAHVKASPMGDGTTLVQLGLTGLDKLQEGVTYGAHVHTGTCVDGNGAAAGPHFQHAGTEPLADREIWLDFTVQRGGVADSETTVDFQVPLDGAGAVVIHGLPATDPLTGVAGPRIACLPVDF